MEYHEYEQQLIQVYIVRSQIGVKVINNFI